MITELAKRVRAEIQLEFDRRQDPRGLMLAISTSLPFARVKAIVESAPAPRRPNRDRPAALNDEAAWKDVEQTALTYAELDELFKDKPPEQ